jgi:hypothetical protein
VGRYQSLKEIKRMAAMPKSKPGCAAYLVALAVVVGLGWLLISLCDEREDIPEAERKARDAVDVVISRFRYEDPESAPRGDLQYRRWCENPKGEGIVVEIAGNCWLVIGDEIWAVTGGLAKLPSIEFSGIPGSVDEETFEVTPKSGLWFEDVEELLKPFD